MELCVSPLISTWLITPHTLTLLQMVMAGYVRLVFLATLTCTATGSER